ncbi:Serine/threonine protein kinase [Hypoxylon texense]
MSYHHGYSSSNTTESTQYGSVFSSTPSGYSDRSVATQYSGYAGGDDEYDNLVYNPPAGALILPCELVGLGSCDIAFNYDRAEEWIDHIIRHLRDKLPLKGACWFCDDFLFDAKATAQGDRHMNFQYRMEHIRGHIADGKTANDIRPDYHMIEHLHKNGVISETSYNQAKEWSEMPCKKSGMDHIHRPDFVPPERRAQAYHNSKVVVEPERRRRHKGKGKK